MSLPFASVSRGAPYRAPHTLCDAPPWRRLLFRARVGGGRMRFAIGRAMIPRGRAPSRTRRIGAAHARAARSVVEAVDWVVPVGSSDAGLVLRAGLGWTGALGRDRVAAVGLRAVAAARRGRGRAVPASERGGYSESSWRTARLLRRDVVCEGAPPLLLTTRGHSVLLESRAPHRKGGEDAPPKCTRSTQTSSLRLARSARCRRSRRSTPTTARGSRASTGPTTRWRVSCLAAGVAPVSSSRGEEEVAPAVGGGWGWGVGRGVWLAWRAWSTRRRDDGPPTVGAHVAVVWVSCGGA